MDEPTWIVGLVDFLMRTLHFGDWEICLFISDCVREALYRSLWPLDIRWRVLL
jgi:hypothetical protein